MAQRSAKRKAEESAYDRTKAWWKCKPENHWCAVCLCRSVNLPWRQLKLSLVLHGEEYVRRTLSGTLRRAREVHHYRGRIGRLLCDVRFFIATCRACREWPHENTVEARALELLAPGSEWNVFPGPEVDGFPNS